MCREEAVGDYLGRLRTVLPEDYTKASHLHDFLTVLTCGYEEMMICTDRSHLIRHLKLYATLEDRAIL